MSGYVFTFFAILSTSLGVVTYKLFSRSKKAYIFIVTVTLMLLAPVFSFLALTQLSVDEVYMATSLNSLLVLILSFYILRERVSHRQIKGALLVFLGVCVYMV